MKKPSIQFYPGDWRKEPTVSCLSLAAKGLWWEMLLLMNEAPRRGFLDMPLESLARSAGSTPRETRKLLAEMERVGTFSRQDGCIVNRRMLREQGISVKRSEAGKKGAESTWQKNGKDDGKLEATGFYLPLPRARIDDEVEAEDENKKTGEGSGEPENDGPLETIQEWLQQYVGHFGIQWPPPDFGICMNVFKALNGASLDDLEAFLKDLYKRKEKPAKNYVWFVTVVKGRFQEWNGKTASAQR